MLRLIARIMKFAGRYAGRISLAFVFSFLTSFMRNVPIALSVWTVGLLLEGKIDYARSIYLLLIMVACMVLQAIFQYASDRLQSTAGFELFADKRRELGDHLRRLPMGYFTEGNIGRISSVVSVDMVFIEENCMNVLADLMSDIFSQIVVTAFVIALNPRIGAVVVAVELISFIIAIPMTDNIRASSTEKQAKNEALTTEILEYAGGFGVIKSFGLRDELGKDVKRSFADMTRANVGFENKYSPYQLALLILFAAGTGIIIYMSSVLYNSGELEAINMIGIGLFLFNMFGPVKHLYQQDARLVVMRAALDRIEDLMAVDEIEDRAEAAPDESSAAPEIEFRNVSFAYENEDVLRDVSFALKRGNSLALVGPSGSGKTTTASLASRFFDIDRGEIMFRGKDIRDISLEALMSNISVVFQRVYLFKDTVRNNIAMGKPGAADDEIYEACRKAGCYDFVMKLPYGFDTIIGEGGSTLSGGEAQRISIARCILKDSPVIILDEATASVDKDNEEIIRTALGELCRDKTLLVIAHRLDTIRSSDEIIVLDGGTVVQRGTHNELMNEDGLYRNMVANMEVGE